MTNPSDPAADFEAFLEDRGIKPADYQTMPEEVQRYFREIWHCEHHIVAPSTATTGNGVAPAAPSAPASNAVQPRPPARPSVVSQPSVGMPAWAVVACAFMLVAFVVMQMRPRTEPAPAPTTVQARSRGAETPSRPERPVRHVERVTSSGSNTASGGRSWRVVGRAEQEAEYTIPFRVTGSKWKVDWMTRAGSAKPSEFAFSIRRPDGRLIERAAHVAGDGEGSMVLRGTGDYALHISSSQPYQVKVFDFR